MDGVIVDAFKPADSLGVVLIPKDRLRQDLYKTAVSDEDGRFEISRCCIR